MANSVKGTSQRTVWSVTLVGVGALLAALLAWLLMNPGKIVTNFSECKAAGGQVMESYPEQCSFNGKTFTNASQSKSGTAAYIGLSEQAALDRAKSENTPARVVERNGESLPVDMSFVEGRLSFSIENDSVTKITVEESGQ